MAFRRRACYVCGQVGHLAENCGSNERLCFNCGKGGHESSACPDPRTTDQKSCYHCLGKGHIKADCPNLGQKSVAAPSDKPVRGLRNPAAAAAAAGGAANVKPSATGCFTCGGPHIARNCPTTLAERSQGVICRNCGGENHFARDCKAPANPAAAAAAGAPVRKPKTCYRCSQAGHIARECPEHAELAPTTPDVALVN